MIKRASLLVILDLNGTLLHRHKYFKSAPHKRPQGKTIYGDPASKPSEDEFYGHETDFDLEIDSGRNAVNRVWYRPYMDHFLKTLLEQCDVAVWTSMEQRNADPLIKDISQHQRHGLKFRWFRHDCTLSPEANDPDASKKDLHKVYDYFGAQYGPHNTILVDDSPNKATGHPLNAIHLPTYRLRNFDTDNALLGVLEYIQYMIGQNVRDVRDFMAANPLFSRTELQTKMHKQLEPTFAHPTTSIRRRRSEFLGEMTRKKLNAQL